MALTGLCCSIMTKVGCLGTFGARLVIEDFCTCNYEMVK